MDADPPVVLGREGLAYLLHIAANLVAAGPQENISSTYSERLSKLTPREREVLGLLCAYRTPKDVAEELNISVYTARDHVDAVVKKLDVHTYKEAANLARKEMMVN